MARFRLLYRCQPICGVGVGLLILLQTYDNGDIQVQLQLQLYETTSGQLLSVRECRPLSLFVARLQSGSDI
jgi:hypothetical protein